MSILSKPSPARRSLHRLVSWRWVDNSTTYGRLESTGDCPHDAAIKKTGSRWAVWVGEGGNPTRNLVGDYTSRKAAEKAALLNVEHLARKTANHMDVRQSCRISGAGAQKPTEGEVAP